MLRYSFVIALAVLLTPLGAAQAKLEVTDLANHPLSVDFASGGRLKLRVRSGDVHVIGVEEDKISVEISGPKAMDARQLTVRFERQGSTAEMRISGGPRNGLTITVRIPAKTDLYARVPFGEVRVEKITGNQDIELHAGDLTIALGDSSAYSHVDASVYSGEVDAAAFGESRGGLFRSFRKDGNGTHRLHVHVGAGQLTLE